MTRSAGGARRGLSDPRQAGVPIVDLSGPAVTVAADVDAACRSIGFLGIVGHGVPDGVVERAFAAATAFFDLPVDERMRVAMPEPGYPYGYSPFSGEALGRSLGADGTTEVDLTVLATDGAPGLQVQSPNGAWIDVAHVDGGFVVNLGDLMARWTNERWRSTMHRVVVPADDPGRRRISIPFFHNANWDARIECVTAPGEAPRYPPVLAGQHLMSKFRSTVSAPPDGSPVA